MPEIPFEKIESALPGPGAGPPDSVHLVFGEDYLVDEAVNAVLDRIFPDTADRSAHVETVDMADGESIYDIVERITTLSFFSATKVLRLKADAVFKTGFSPEDHLRKIEEARLSDDIRLAANILKDILTRQGAAAEDVLTGDPAKAVGADPSAFTPKDWIVQAAGHLSEAGADTASATSADAAAILRQTIEKGLPDGHFLVITTPSADRRTALYKTVSRHHTAINCTVPAGARKADVDAQKAILSSVMRKILAKHAKSADSKVFGKVYELTGFAPRVFAGNIEKLAFFAGDAKTIRAEDVDAVLGRTREDPVFVFTNALLEKNAPGALYHLKSLLDAGFHYLQIHSAITSQVRKLLCVKLFMQSPYGRDWKPGMRFDAFKGRVLPRAVEYDRKIADAAAAQSEQQAADSGQASGRGAGKKKKGAKTAAKKPSDLAIVKNPNNPYPIFQGFLQADRFSASEIRGFMIRLHDADVRLKTSGSAPGAVLEELVLHICYSNEPSGK